MEDSAANYPTVPCPKCGRMLKAGGEIVVSQSAADEGPALPVYQCDECLVERDFLGETTETALTFCIDAHGNPIDPAEPDEVLRF